MQEGEGLPSFALAGKEAVRLCADVHRHPSDVPLMPTQMLMTVLMDAQPWLFTVWGNG